MFSDFAPILVIIAVILLIYGYSWRLAPSLTYGGSVDGEMGFYTSFMSSINLIFGNSPDTLGDDGQPQFTVIAFIIYAAGNVTLALVLLNFLIALISGTSQRVTENKDLNDCRELLPLIQDFDLFLKWKRTRNTDPDTLVGKNYVLLVEASPDDDSMLQQ